MDPTINELIKGYMDKAERKLNVAKKLLASEDYEDAVSRAYYASLSCCTGTSSLRG